ncbi:fucolectin-like [Pseudorasbora parva]|uniref:fucolectin-like n=1 Tax=Pseudorasbora parva TaxID=51549 RepID=UPI00351DD961
MYSPLQVAGNGLAQVSSLARHSTPRTGYWSQPTTFSGQSAYRAHDGGKDFSIFSNSCAVSRIGANPWWRLDLQASYQVDIVVVTYRLDCCPDRWNGVEIHFGNSLENNGNDNPRCAVRSVNPVTSSVTYSCGGMEGQYLNVLLHGSLVLLQLCEVEVYKTIQEVSLDHIRRSFMKLAFNSSSNLTDPTVTEQVLKELTSALAMRGITNVTLSWSQTPQEEDKSKTIPEADLCSD